MTNGVNNFSFAEEVWHAITHGVGFFLSIAALTLLVSFAAIGGKPINIVAASIYGTALVVMYGSSTLYHAITHKEVKQFFQKFDHSAIYFLIAGSYTPVLLITIVGFEGWILFSIEWLIATIGITLKFMYPGRFEALSMVAYILMGWLIVVIFETFKNSIDPVGFWLMLTGGIAYNIGIVFFIKGHKKHFHTIWHLFVLVGSIFQFFAILLYVI